MTGPNEPGKPPARRPRRVTPRPTLRAVTDEAMDQVDPTYGAVYDHRNVLWPGLDFIDGTLYITIPVPKNEEKQVGRGKNQHIEIEQNDRTMCITSEGEAFWYDKETVMRRGFSWPGTLTQEKHSRWPLEDMLTFRSGDVANVDPASLWAELRQLVFDHVEYGDDGWYDVVAYYIMLSYVFRIFDSLGYLHFNGTAASGKSQNLRLLSALGFNAIWASNFSPASLYRQIAGCPGMMCLDELESFEGERGDTNRSLLNAGYTNPGWVTRTEPTSEGVYAVTQYPTYSPKALASINPLDPVLSQRCLIVPMQPALRRIKHLSEKNPKWPGIRSRLYLWAMQNAFEISEIHEHWQQAERADSPTSLRDRTWEIAMPFVVLGQHTAGKPEATRLIHFFEGVFEKQRAAAEETDRQRLLLSLLPRVFATKESPDGEWWSVGDINAVVKDYLEKDAAEFYSTKATGKHLVSLGFRDRKKHKGGTMARISEQEVRDQFTKRHITPLDEDLDWAAGKISYFETNRANAKPDPQAGFDWQDADAAATDDGADRAPE